ncbi:amino acid adenylation domain-containing protein [Streptomyces olivaceus]|uniref:non-ribosomal peptide synthetase n=1 Tax=Streptomyces olivaceus TaxID=47716 RepID=UPI001CCD9DDC|nr:non-ribosomal peptide synthetase [Streptomyces olivaceus]MBZ6204382.1 amino acid adenylation domain-containing protein [Streptomyces olivaceus]MBZ6210485.1 amino acid adenylation domain-containing protein [Streptomyces olivaceus]MBZ6304505.1 amino acid adenylation domain-containing protein [Streptomyces olivaceus]MBZ6321944.1 amino acid adenylation domain-containing protein [Streptomyces olivaceus]
MNIPELLARYADEGVVLWAQDGQLRFRAPQGRLTDTHRAELRTHKQDILRHLEAGRPALRPDPDSRHEPFPLTDIQAAYLIGRTDAYAYGGVGCHAYVELDHPELDVERVTAVWRELVERHDMLRAVVHHDGYQQVLADVPDLHVACDDLTGLPAADAEAELARTRARLSARETPTDQWPLFDVHVSRTAGRAVLHLSFDMLVVDHASLRILLAEFRHRYGGGVLSAAPRITFRDYVLARRAQTGIDGHARDRAYWTERLDTLPPAPELPLAEPWEAAVGASTGTRGAPTDAVTFRRLEVPLSAADRERLTERAARRGLTVSTALLTAYAETVGRWSRTSRFTLNVPTVDRPDLHEDIGRLVGDFTSLELLAVDLDTPAAFAERTGALGQQLLEDLAHPLFTGSEVLAELSRRAGAPVLMPVVFTSALGTGGTAEGVPPEVAHAATRTPQVWLDCQVMHRGDALILSWDVREGALAHGVAEDMFGAWTSLVRLLSAEGEEGDAAWDAPVDIPLPAAQRDRRAAANATGGPLPDALLHEPLLDRARTTPDAIAVRTPETALTYRQLADRAGGVAETLTASGLRPGEPVAVWTDKGWEQVVAVLGTLMAGGAYLPVDTAQPPARRDTILADAGVRTVLTQSWLAETDDLPATVSAVAVDLVPAAPATREPRTAPRRDPDDLAYVIYTSGSTGTPKGVMISHRAALNTVQDINRRYAVTDRDRVLGIAGLGFDLSVYDLFGPLAVGATLVLPRADRRGDPSHWAELVRDFGVTVWNSVPGQLHMLCDWLRSEPPADDATLRLALISGDWIPVALPDQARALLPGLEIISLGGATEGSIWSIAHPIGEVDTDRPSIPYGTPLTNQTFAVLDRHLRPRPEWVPGELFIGGAGVALGYLGDEARTAERFLTDPRTGQRLYRTGDLGRYLPDGTIEFLGREDAQIKIRGYRVELAEVEAAVQAHPAVAAGAVVVDDSAAGGRRLAAFVETARRDGDRRAAPGARQAREAAADAVREASAAVDGARLADFLAALDEVALDGMTRVLAGSAVFEDGAARTADEVGTALRATPRHRHIVRRWLRALAARDRITHRDTDDTYSGLVAVSGPDTERRWRLAADLEHEIGWSSELLTVMRTCAERLPELVAGDVGIRDLLFPGAATDAADAAYRDNLAIRHLNRAVVAALREIAASHTGEERLRILEVGGGVGGTTGELVPVLAEYGVDYLFTDPSAFFLNEARERFADHTWVRYQRFDVDQDPRGQHLPPNTFDVVVCANTLHAAADADAAVGRLRELLVPGGQLVFVENTRDENLPLLVSMEFLEVAGRPWTDVREHTGQSFLTHPQWRELLGRHTASDVTSLPEGQDALARTGQEVFLATMKDDRHHVPTGELARTAATRLPEYMLPAVWQVVDTLPRTANGKTDRARLVDWLPRESAPVVVDERPRDELENSLADLWSELLAVEGVTRNDDFFDLGGDSLLVARMVGRLRERVPRAADLEWEVVLRHMLRRPTVAGLAGFLRSLADPKDAPAPGAVRTDPVIHLHGARSDDEPTTVLVHAGTATIMPYRALITEIRRRSPGLAEVVGVEVPDLNGFLAAPPQGLIEQLAADYARALTADGRSRFHVVGYCLGGLIATEVARNLAESGAEVESLTVISSHSPRFRLDDELLAEYSFAVMMGIDPAELGFPDDQYRVAAAADAVLASSPGILPDGGLAALPEEFEDVAGRFRSLAEVPRATRIARMCEAVPASAGSYEPDHMSRLFLAFRQSVFAITRYTAEPYAGDITFLRHDGAYPFPGSKDAVTTYWEELTLGDLDIVDIGGDHYSCLSVEHAPGILKTLGELTRGAITR